MKLRKALGGGGWGWVPGVYFAEGLPFAVATCVSMVMFSSLGMSNSAMAFWTGVIGLPWSLKFLWAPLMDAHGTKRRWMLAAQMAIALSFAAIAFVFRSGGADGWLIACFLLTAFCSATHDIAADGFYMLGLTEDQQAFFIGIRNTFYRVAMLTGQGLLVMLAGFLEEKTGRVPFAWSLVFFVLAGTFIGLALWHKHAMPLPSADRRRADVRPWTILKGFGDTFVSFFRKPGIGMALLFMLTYRLGESQLVKLASPFLLDSPEAGGLGLSTGQVGFAYGTVGVIALLLGGILGGMALSKGGLRRWLWPMALAISLPNLVYLYLAYVQPESVFLINACVAIEQFGYGFGFTAYTMYLILFSEGEYKTAHYAICTGFMALGMMLPGMISGWIQEMIGYQYFFIWVMVCCVPLFVILPFLKVKERS